MVGTGKVIVILFVVKGPVLRIGHSGSGSHLLRHRLRIVEHFDLHSLMVTLFAAVVGAVVVLVPMLIAGSAGKGGIVGEGNNRPVFADKLVARCHQSRRVEQVEHGGDVGWRPRTPVSWTAFS